MIFHQILALSSPGHQSQTSSASTAVRLIPLVLSFFLLRWNGRRELGFLKVLLSGILIKCFSPCFHSFLRRLMEPFRAVQKHMEVCTEFGRGIFNIIHRELLISSHCYVFSTPGIRRILFVWTCRRRKNKIRPSSTYLLSFLSTFIFLSDLCSFLEEQRSFIKLIFVTWLLGAS